MLGLACAPRPADASCGVFVGGTDASRSHDVIEVVLMRDGTHTVVSIQSDYRGPVEDFALIMPVPPELEAYDVKTLPKALFERVDRLAAPRLVEYFELDPCYKTDDRRKDQKAEEQFSSTSLPERGIAVEAEFVVGEYDVQIVAAESATQLDAWLHEHDYAIPAAAAPLLRPHVEAGMKFLVAKVDAQKLEFEGSRAELSPLRIHYESPEFTLPVRLGQLNAQGPQELLIHVLATERHQVANYPNALIPTNLVVRERARDAFGQFYVALFDQTLAEHPGAFVTEYAWESGSCDPCTQPPLELDDLRILGLDVLPRFAMGMDPYGKPLDSRLYDTVPAEFVLTRLHARLDASSLGDDIVFEPAPPLSGGHGLPNSVGELEAQTLASPRNQFQARYVVLHPWAESAWCFDPEVGRWTMQDGARPRAAINLAFEARDAVVDEFLGRDPLPEKSCRCTSERSPAGLGLALLALLRLRRRAT